MNLTRYSCTGPHFLSAIIRSNSQFIELFEICTGTLPLPLGEVPRRGGEGKWHRRHPLHFRDYESITKSFVGNGLVPFHLYASSSPVRIPINEQTYKFDASYLISKWIRVTILPRNGTRPFPTNKFDHLYQEVKKHILSECSDRMCFGFMKEYR